MGTEESSTGAVIRLARKDVDALRADLSKFKSMPAPVRLLSINVLLDRVEQSFISIADSLELLNADLETIELALENLKDARHFRYGD